MQIVREKVLLDELKMMAKNMFGRMVKAVVDIEREIMAVDAELHADEEEILLNDGSRQENLWGINIHPDMIDDKDWIEFDSMINVRPSIGNMSRGVDDPKLQEKIKIIIDKLVKK